MSTRPISLSRVRKHFVCNRCFIVGEHHHNDCPGVKRATGIPRTFLQAADPGDKGAVVTRNGVIMVNRMEKQAFEEKKNDGGVSPPTAPPNSRLDPPIVIPSFEPPPRRPVKRINYMTAPNQPFVHARFILEVGNKLNAKVMTVATALANFHKFCKATSDLSLYDPYLMASACLYLAGKIEDNDHLKLRDIINVVWTTLHPDQEPLPLDSEYYNMREALVHSELHILRMVGFKTRHDHPHRYLLHYLKSLRDWFPEEIWEKYPLAKTSWALLQDSYHDQNLVLESDPSELSLACVQLALQTYGLQVPLTSNAHDSKSWIRIFNSNVSKDKIWDLMTRLMDTYNHDVMFITPNSEEIASLEDQ